MGTLSLTGYERETVINLNDDETVAYVYSAQRPILRKLEAHAYAELVDQGSHQGSPWAKYKIPAKYITISKPRRRLTAEQRLAAAAHLASARSHLPENPKQTTAAL